MKQLNMMVEDEVKQAAVDGARAAGMLLNKWVSRAILAHAVRQIEGPTPPVNLAPPVPLTYTPTWENEFLTDVWKYFPKDGLCVGQVVKISATRWDALYRDEQIGALSTREKAQAAVVAAWEQENA